VAALLGIGTFEYIHQHERIHVVGQTIDVSDLAQVILQPADAATGNKTPFIRLTGQRQMVSLLRLLSQSTLDPSAAVPRGDHPVAVVYVEFEQQSILPIHITGSDSDPKHVWLVPEDRSGRVYIAPATLVQQLARFEAH
jgi:hypothetical protein